MPANTYTIECKYSPGDMVWLWANDVVVQAHVESLEVEIFEGLEPAVFAEVCSSEPYCFIKTIEENCLYPTEAEAKAAREGE